MRREQFQVHTDLEDRHWWFVGRRVILRRLVSRILSPSASALVVDVGCGTGANIASFALDYATVGIDTSSEAIESARRRFPRVDFMCGEAPRDLGQIAGSASLFLLNDVIEHISDEIGFVSALLAASRPGAQLLVTVPAGPGLWTEHDVSFGHYRRYTLGTLQQVWAGQPVACRLLTYFNSHLYPIVRLQRGINRYLGRSSGTSGTDFWLPHPTVNTTLKALFASEAGRLARAVDGAGAGYRRGVSAIALLTRLDGEVQDAHRPA